MIGIYSTIGKISVEDQYAVSNTRKKAICFIGPESKII